MEKQKDLAEINEIIRCRANIDFWRRWITAVENAGIKIPDDESIQAAKELHEALDKAEQALKPPKAYKSKYEPRFAEMKKKAHVWSDTHARTQAYLYATYEVQPVQTEEELTKLVLQVHKDFNWTPEDEKLKKFDADKRAEAKEKRERKRRERAEKLQLVME